MVPTFRSEAVRHPIMRPSPHSTASLCQRCRGRERLGGAPRRQVTDRTVAEIPCRTDLFARRSSHCWMHIRAVCGSPRGLVEQPEVGKTAVLRSAPNLIAAKPLTRAKVRWIRVASERSTCAPCGIEPAKRLEKDAHEPCDAAFQHELLEVECRSAEGWWLAAGGVDHLGPRYP